jgi:hypothetical protein
MSHESIFRSSRFFLVLLVVLLTVIAGCDSPVQPSELLSAADISRLDPSDNSRQRDDPARNRVWILNSHGLFVYETASGKLLEIPLPSWHWVGMPHSCPPDVALGPGGEVVVTSNVVPVMWRIDPKTLTVSVHELALNADYNKDIGFSRLAYSAENGAYFAVSDVHGSVWRIDRALQHGRKIAQIAIAQGACRIALPRGSE